MPEQRAVRFPHLGLTEWPFSVVPTPRGTTFMADRAELAVEIAELLERLSRRPQSSIHLMWAWFGAGKTHALRYLSHVAKTSFDNLEPIYTEFPQSALGFRDIYRQVAASLDVDQLADAYLEEATTPGSSRQYLGLKSDIRSALSKYLSGTQSERIIARQWLFADEVALASLRALGIDHVLASPEDCCQALAELAYLYGLSKKSTRSGTGRLIWIIDEFQRLTACPPEVRREINTGLNALLNLSPNHLTILLSFSGRPESSLPSWISPDLTDRLGIDRVLVLPPLRLEESKIFLADVLREYRPQPSRRAAYFPFEEKAVDAVIDFIGKNAELKPRSLMQFFGAILEEADLEIERGGRKSISRDFALKCLAGRSFRTDSDALEEMLYALQESRARALSAKESMQKEIAAHLHGPVQGRLLGLRAKLDELARADTMPADASKNLQSVIDDMDQVIQREIAALSRRLYPAIIRRGLVPSLQSLCDQFESTLDIELSIDPDFAGREHHDPRLLDEQTKLSAYRVAEEAVNNIVKHASSSHVSMQLQMTHDSWLILTVRDDGAGFDTQRSSVGLGLSEMKDYAESVGGNCVINSQPGRGTEVAARLPVPTPAETSPSP